MSSAPQKPRKLQAAASSQSISSSEAQAKPHTTKVGRSHVDDNESYESTQLASRSHSPPKVKHESSVVKAGGSPVDQNEAEESTRLASSLQSGSDPETKIKSPVQKSRRGPVDENEGQESTQMASSLQSSFPKTKIESPAVETGGSPAGDNYVEESTQLASSLQSISSSQRKELKSRIKEARENLLKESKKRFNDAPLQGVSSVQAHLKHLVVKKDDKSLDDIAKVLEKASNLMLEARLVIRSLYINRANETENYCRTYPPAKDIYEHIHGVIQSKNHADFVFETPLYPQLSNSASRAIMEPRFDCQFIYDPTSDNCLLVNRSVGWEIFLSLSTSPLKRTKILGSHVLHPGMWMISVKGQDSNQHYPALEILIAPRRFSVSIYRENISLPSKRTLEDDGKLAKRQRLGDGTKKIAVDRSADLIPKISKESFIHNHTPREFHDKTISPILDLADGETAVIEASHASPVNTRDSYRLQRIKNVVLLRATSVFTCQHSELPEDIVAKVLRYSNNSIYNLIGITRSWKDERKALNNLHHVSNLLL